MNPLIAIILVNYDGIKDTIECVKSIKKSNYENYKIILVDNNSNDSEMIKHSEDLSANCDIILLDRNLGFSGGNNKGIIYAREKYRPDYYMLLNNDTVIQENTLITLLRLTEKTPKVGITTCQINYFYQPELVWFGDGKFDYNTGMADMPGLGKREEYHTKGVREITFATGCLFFIPSSVIQDIGLLDESFFLYSEDAEYSCRVQKCGYKIIYTTETKIYHKISASTGQYSKMQQYYMFRNNCYMIQRFCKYPLLGYLKRFYRTIKEVNRGEYQVTNVIKAWRDYKKGIIGKVDF